MELEIYSFRKYGEPQLVKPKELKGIKPVGIPYIPKKCTCQVFVLSDRREIWIKHKDYFSPSFKVPDEDFGAPLPVILEKYFNKDKKKKFNYHDCWGDIVLRQEAYLKLTNVPVIKYYPETVQKILRIQEQLHDFEEFDLCGTYMERFWEEVFVEYNKHFKEYDDEQYTYLKLLVP